jgi:hypothetical protein
MARSREGSEARIVGAGALLCSALLFLVIDLVRSPGAVHAAALVDFSLKTASLAHDKQKPGVDKLAAKGSFRLGAGNNGANPANESVTLTIGPFSQTIPPATFTRKDTRRKTIWAFKGAKGGLTKMVITQAGEQWVFSAAGAGLTLVGITNPITVSLQIGDDSGSRSLFFVVTDTPRKQVLKFPAGKKDDADGDGFTPKAPKGEQPDCDDQDPTVFPGAPELCDGIDNDCSGQADEGFDLGVICSGGAGACQRDGVKVCAPDESGTVCNAVPGDSTPEVCNGIDDDCNSQVDDGLGTTACGLGACQHTAQNCVGGVAQVCDPLQGASPEICGNTLDEDCDGVAEPCPPLALTITTPENLALFNLSQLAIAGTADPIAVAVTCNDQPVSLTAGSFSGNLTLHEGPNILTCVARDGAGRIGTASITVTLDTMPPRVTINSPPEGATLTAAPVTVTGIINDIVVGTVNQQEAQVECNGVSAQIGNRTFLATNIPLTPGANTITCTGTDRAGNVDSGRVHVTLETPTGPTLTLVSGNNQTGPIGALLPDPLIVSLIDNNLPMAGRTVLFRVLRNDGALSVGSLSGRFLPIVTDANGQAQVNFTLGTWAGAGNNQVQATAPGVVGESLFNESALPGSAASIVVDAGNLQFGVVGQPLPRPFIAVVIDQGHNRLGGTPVTFRVVQGGGNFSGQSELTVNTDSDGRAQAVLTLGPDEGFDNNMVSAAFPNSPATTAMFIASGKVAGDPTQTRISGVVLDNTNQPVPGVTVYIDGSPLTTQSNDQGQFVLQPAPVGHVLLVADGATAASRNGRPWPTLEYELVTIAGRDNTIGMPIFLLPIDTPNGLLVDETTGGTLTLAEVPGFSLTIVPGSATFPDGSKRGTVSVTMVHPDKVPMVPNFGQQPRFIITIQPAGVHFNPPAAMTVPNADGFAPGQKTEMYSFDHDLGQFVSIGPGTVSDDGMVIASDPGVGVIKGGWHCGGNPTGFGSCEHECDDGNDCTEDFRIDGACATLDRPDGTPCRDAPTNTISCNDGVFVNAKIFVDNSCNTNRCQSGQCEPVSFSVATIQRATCNIVRQTLGGLPCVGEPLRGKMLDNLNNKGLRILCEPSSQDHCAYAPSIGGNTIVFEGSVFTDDCNSAPGSGAATVLHELVHAHGCDPGAPNTETHNMGGPEGIPDPADKAFGCEEACFPGVSPDANPLACR